ncbi:MAG: transposase [Kiritimatiellae bacterium]|nr:transposase [Kiritimatiellia bacterium]
MNYSESACTGEPNETALRRRFSGVFKASVVLEALEGGCSVQELAERHRLHPNQIRNWKSQFRKRLPELFQDRRLSGIQHPTLSAAENDRILPDGG